MRGIYDYDTGVYRDIEEINSEESESTHTYNEDRCKRCDFSRELLMHLVQWKHNALADIRNLDVASRETIGQHFELLRRHLDHWHFELLLEHVSHYLSR